jgi:hypothetical protein
MHALIRNLFVLTLLFCCTPAFAGVKRALIIGIDTYEETTQTPAAFAARGEAERAGWKNLNGCVNDARSVKQLIMARYGFMEENIDTLMNRQATHESILNAIHSLIGKCQPQSGDVVLIYYAGHGSQVKNSRSYDGTGQDQTMVPSDLWDIRNKELAPLFNQLLDNGVTLTLIYDCCHSGGIARGNSLPVEYITRQAPPLNFDADDDSKAPNIEERGALVFSAAQRDQTAKEAVDADGIAHGAFTLALIRAINSATTNESAGMMFTRIVANLKSDGGPKFQDPVMGANDQRRNATLFGTAVSDVKAKTVVGVQEIIDGFVRLRGGFELSIYPGCRFAKPDGKDTLEVTAVAGIGTSLAKVVKGNVSAFHPGDIVEMLNWVTPDRPTLLIWSPAATMTTDELNAAIAPVKALFASGHCVQLKDQTESAPEYVIQYHIDHWVLSQSGKSKMTGLTALNEKMLKKVIRKGATVSLQLPPTKEFDAALHTRIGAGTDNSAIDFTSDPMAANYMVAGRMNGRLEYALIRPNVSKTDVSSSLSLPLRSTWIGGEQAAKGADSIATYAIRLGKLNAWMNLASPPDEFPYYLGLKHKNGTIVQPGETVYGGDRLELILVLDTINFKPFYCQRYINVFGVDQQGKMALLYPRPELGDGNKIEYRGKYQSKRIIPLEKTPGGEPLGFNVTAPYGYDTYFMVASETPLPADIFRSDGVLERGPGKTTASPLANMMRNYGARTRSFEEDPPAVTSELWCVRKLQVLSAER